MEIERTDFVSVPVQAMERAKAFYRDTLGLHSPDWEEGGRGVEFSGENDTGVCKMAFFSDSEGNSLMLHRRYAP